jgi:TRAP-type mannitol/chloroaromatic compound transport system permease small subunit
MCQLKTHVLRDRDARGECALLTLVRLSDQIRRLLERIAFAGGWLLVVLMCVTCFDVLARRFGLGVWLGIPGLLTPFQESEWWLHTGIFSTWMGYNYVNNAHPRVDSYTENVSFRGRAWLELIGCLLFALPYMMVVCWFSIDHWWQSWLVDEGSESAVGLPNRWIIKGIFVIGLWLVLLAVVSVIMRLVAFLFGGVPQEVANLQIGKSELEV